MNDLEQAAVFIEKILRIEENSNLSRFSGKIFSLTLQNYKKRLDPKSTEQRSSQLVERMSKKLFKLDLFEYCTQMHSEFVTNK